MMQCLKPNLWTYRCVCNRSFISSHRTKRQGCTKRSYTSIDLIKGKPVFHQILIAVKNCITIFFKQRNDIPVSPSVIFLYQCIWHLIMAQSYQWFNPVFLTFFKNIFIEDKPLFVRLFFHSCWINPRPVDRCSENSESHLRKKGNILFVMMIKINCLMTWIKSVFSYLCRNTFWIPLCSIRTQIRN